MNCRPGEEGGESPEREKIFSLSDATSQEKNRKMNGNKRNDPIATGFFLYFSFPLQKGVSGRAVSFRATRDNFLTSN